MKYRFKIIKTTSSDLTNTSLPYYTLYAKLTFWQKIAYISGDRYISSCNLKNFYGDEEEVIKYLKNLASQWLTSEYTLTATPKPKYTDTTLNTFTLETTDGKTTNEVR